MATRQRAGLSREVRRTSDPGRVSIGLLTPRGAGSWRRRAFLSPALREERTLTATPPKKLAPSDLIAPEYAGDPSERHPRQNPRGRINLMAGEAVFLVPIPSELLELLHALVATAVRDELSHLSLRDDGFLDVKGAAAYISSTPQAIRSLVKRNDIPYHKAPNGRLLFDRDELDHWARTG